MRLPVFKPIFEWWTNPPSWFTSATKFVAALILSSPVKSEDRLYRISKFIVAVLLVLYSALVTACLVRVLYAIFSGSPDDINKLLLALGGVIGGPFLIWRTLIAYQQTSISREGNYTSLFTRAVEQLGATREVQRLELDKTTTPHTSYSVTETEPNLEVRLGALYALERIAHDSERDHWPIMEVLCSYIRNPQNAGIPKTEEEIRKSGKSPPPPRTDIQAAVTIIGRRPDIRIAFETLRDHYLNLADSNLQSAVVYRQKFPAAQFSAASLQNCQFQRSDLSGSRFLSAKLTEANFSLTNIGGATFDFADANKSLFIGASAEAASFAKAKLGNANFTDATLDRAVFVTAELAGASFDKASLAETIFRGSNLVGATFKAAKFNFVRDDIFPRSPAFKGAVLFDTDFSESSGLAVAELEGSIGDYSIKLPPDVLRPSTWASKHLNDMERIDAKYGHVPA